MKIINGNILDTKKGIICHQINCKGVMGAGLALQIRNRWIHVYNDYRKYYLADNLKLGFIFLTQVTDGLFVANLCGQDDYRGKRPLTDYDALRSCFEQLSTIKNISVYIPYGIGCGLAGGNWKTVEQIISETIPNAIIVKYN